MIIPAARTPMAIVINDFFLSRLSKIASNDPVQAPVPGSGIPTNKNRPK